MILQTLKSARSVLCVVYIWTFLLCLVTLKFVHQRRNGRTLGDSCEDWKLGQSTTNNDSLLVLQNNYSSRYLKYIGLDDASIYGTNDVTSAKTKSKPMKFIIVTATSSNHVTNTMRWLNMMAKLNIGFPVLVFDLDLTKDQRKQIRSTALCKLRRFPRHKLPTFVVEKPDYIAWKPILIQICLQEYERVIWMDTSVRLRDRRITAGLEIAEKHGLAVPYNVGIAENLPLPFTTNQQTFQSFGYEPCSFYKVSSFNAAILFVRKTRHILENVIRPWVMCALHESCIRGNSTDKRYSFSCDGANSVGFCHRFDTSALSIVLHSLYKTEEDIRKIDLAGKVDWVKCYDRPSVIIMDGILFQDSQKYKQDGCETL